MEATAGAACRMADRVDVFRLPMQGPADTAPLLRLLDGGALDVRHIVALLGKTEGNGGVNDFTREYAASAFAASLAPRLGLTPEAVEDRIAMVMSGGTEGVLSPHVTVFARVPDAGVAAPGKRLAIGVAATRELLAHEIGRAPQIEETVPAIHAAMRDAGITDPADVHFVQIKCPLLTADRAEAAMRAGHAPVTKSSYASMGYSRGASSLGVALALGEIAAPVPESAVLRDWDLYSAVASASAGIELMRNIVIVMGNAAGMAGDCKIGHAVMRDAIDLAGVLEAFRAVGLAGTGDAGRIVNVLAKAEPSPDGMVRGFRHIMLDDTDISATRHARAAVGGLIAGLAGSGAVYVSGGAEHQGPAGGGPVAVIARVV
jgi:cyanuric acid amidohydrolase